ncbi:MAG: regulator of sigma E protease [Hyphomicrobiaceae bacterium]|jgi:regulator of sigma E protease
MAFGSIASAIGVLALVIFVHELGHFLVAKWCDVEVRTFSMGFGPTIWARTWGETEYRVAAIPLGGYVSMAGQDDGFEDEKLSASDPSRGFTSKGMLPRAAIIAAGPGANFVFAFVVFASLAFTYGTSVPVQEPIVGDLTPGAPAEVAGLLPGDQILSIGGQAIVSWEEIPPAIISSGGAELALVLRGEDGTERTAVLVPEMREKTDMFGEVTGKSWYIGVGRPLDSKVVGLFESVKVGAQQTTFYSGLIATTLWRLIQGRLSSDDLGGPLLIAREASRQAESGLGPLLGFMALISINLGIVNLLPFPVLDGGHLAFISFEAVRGKPLPTRVRDGAMQVGMVVLGALMLFVVVQDIVKIVTG